MKKETKTETGHRAVAKALNLPISTKHCIEISSFLRYKSTRFAKEYLQNVVTLRKAIPFKKFIRDIGHKAGMSAGRFPRKAAAEFLKLLNSVEANAQSKGLNTSSLKIIKLLANRAAVPMTGGRRRRGTKRTHIEIEVSEVSRKKEKKEEKIEKKDVDSATSENKNLVKEKTSTEKQKEPKIDDSRVKDIEKEMIKSESILPEVKTEELNTEKLKTKVVKTEVINEEVKPKALVADNIGIDAMPPSEEKGIVTNEPLESLEKPVSIAEPVVSPILDKSEIREVHKEPASATENVVLPPPPIEKSQELSPAELLRQAQEKADILNKRQKKDESTKKVERLFKDLQKQGTLRKKGERR